MDPTIVFDIQPGPYWDWKVAIDLFLGGAGVGAFLFSVGLYEFWGRKYRRVPQTAAFLAPVLVIFGLLFLLLKLGKPLSLVLTFTNFAPTSPLWWGGIFQTVFVVGSLIYASKWRDTELNPTRRKLGLALVPIAVIVGVYHGLLLAVITARPIWNKGSVGVAALLASLSTGIAAVMLVHLLRMKFGNRLTEEARVGEFFEDLKPVRNLLAGTLVLQLGTLFLWWLELYFGTLEERLALDAANLAWGTSFWGIGIILGLILPLLIGGWLVWRGEAVHRRSQVLMIGLTSVLILVGGAVFRLAVLLGGQIQHFPMTLS